jgi:hypothetical protein
MQAQGKGLGEISSKVSCGYELVRPSKLVTLMELVFSCGILVQFEASFVRFFSSAL